ncbi:hypothetical protein TURU_041674 [Turdus rufiventris]|nr:hypothetical protein TURU_041674 [Turdus rufiventris]
MDIGDTKMDVGWRSQNGYRAVLQGQVGFGTCPDCGDNERDIGDPKMDMDDSKVTLKWTLVTPKWTWSGGHKMAARSCSRVRWDLGHIRTVGTPKRTLVTPK